jgi:threonine dehydratase
VVMPEHTPLIKVANTRRFGAGVRFHGATLSESMVEAHRIEKEERRVLVHAYDDERVIAGQGTIGLELAEQVPDVETVLIPVGGGGLAAGISIALRAKRPKMRLVGVEVRRGGFTIADGIAVKKTGELTTGILDEVLDGLVSVTDEEISQAIVLLLERTKLVVEGAGAVGVAALLSGKVDGDGVVVPVLSGGNIDATLLISVTRHGLAVAGRYLVVRSRVPDRPGGLVKLLTLLANERVNVVDVGHYRETANLPLGDTGVELTLVTRDSAHCDEILATMARLGYPAERLT